MTTVIKELTEMFVNLWTAPFYVSCWNVGLFIFFSTKPTSCSKTIDTIYNWFKQKYICCPDLEVLGIATISQLLRWQPAMGFPRPR